LLKANLIESTFKMDDIGSYVTYDEGLETLICRSCQYGLNPNGVRRHYRRCHKELPLKIRNKIIEWCDMLVARPLKDVQIPTREVDAIDGLKVFDGFMCETCGALCGTPLSIRYHCRTSHDWTVSKSDSLNYLRER
jgi:Orsellinic acid/F9775 biosynthesis cluster protein D